MDGKQGIVPANYLIPRQLLSDHRTEKTNAVKSTYATKEQINEGSSPRKCTLLIKCHDGLTLALCACMCVCCDILLSYYMM